MTVETKQRARRKAFRPDEILDAALEEFTRNGYAGTRLDDVAARAGITKGTIYVYFPSKEELFRAVVAQVPLPVPAGCEPIHRHSKEVHRRVSPGPPGIYLSNHASRPERPRGIPLDDCRGGALPRTGRGYHREVIAPVIEKLREAIEQGVARGEMRRSAALEFPEIVVAPAALMHLWLLVFSNRVPVDADRYLEAHLDLMLHGLVQPGA